MDFIINKTERSKHKTRSLSIVLFLLAATKIGVMARQSAQINPFELPKEFFTI